MKHPIPDPDARAVIELDAPAKTCTIPGCGGAVVRHSLGEGQSIHRCMRCFRRYQLRGDAAAADDRKSRIRRMFDDFVTWRE